MRRSFAMWPLMIGAALALLVLGCKRRSVPAQQPVVHTLPAVKTEPNFYVGPLPVEAVDDNTITARKRTVPARSQTQTSPAVDAATIAAEQRRQDAKLLQQQQAASQKQQDELNKEVQANIRAQQQMQAVPTVQEAPPASPTGPIPSPAPVPPQD